MDTNKTIYRILIIIYLCIGLTKAIAQRNVDSLELYANRFYEIGAPKISQNGNWIAYKKYGLERKDSLFVYNTSKMETPHLEKSNIHEFQFLEEDLILMKDQDGIEIKNLADYCSVKFLKIKNYEVLPTKKQIVIHYNDTLHNNLEIRDFTGKVLSEISNVEKYFISDKKNAYAYKIDVNNQSEIYLLSEAKNRKIVQTPHKIEYIEFDKFEENFIVYSKKANCQELIVEYFDGKNNTRYSLNELISEKNKIEFGLSEILKNKQAFLMRLYFKKEQNTQDYPDIWYTYDNSLEEKFKDQVEQSYIWSPLEKEIIPLNEDKYNETIPLNGKDLFLNFNPYLLNNYTTIKKEIEFKIFNIGNHENNVLDTLILPLYKSNNGNYLLSKKKLNWQLNDLKNGSKFIIKGDELTKPYFTQDENIVLFEGLGGLWLFDIKKRQIKPYLNLENWNVKIQNQEEKNISSGFLIYENPVDLNDVLLIKLENKMENLTAFLTVKKGVTNWLIEPTNDLISHIDFTKDFKKIVYTKENFNISPQIVYSSYPKSDFIVSPYNINANVDKNIKQEIVKYSNSQGEQLKGILYYPINYKQGNLYPMVVNIYGPQYHLANKYLSFIPISQNGFNTRFLIDNDYFVFLPDIKSNSNGTGIDALADVNAALDAIKDKPINPLKIGLIGHSLGGYETLFIATKSNRFATYIAGAGVSNIIKTYHNFNYDFLSPDYMRLESEIFKMNVPFTPNKELYFRNNPILYAENVKVPILLWSGSDDQNVPKEESMAFHLALRRNDKPSVLLIYKNEGHILFKKEHQFDLFKRTIEWFNYFLKEKQSYNWINKGLKKDAY